ncbi:mitochondrial E3 ubiquitin protein ligase 1-like [Atheta coriaria]|uniref:mitochondrial E3 ubiquitin protein ligase 1-like n=1 Tax=Dalotia coriaria TaxID=877792 RepID=UPI0031F33F36
MDYLGEGIAIAINGVVFTYVLKQFLRRQHAVSMVQGAPLLEINRELKDIVDTHPDKKLNYVAVKGVIAPIGKPIQSVNNRDIEGVIQLIKTQEHVVQRSSAGFWSDHERVIQESKNVMPFALEANGFQVEIVDPLAADILDLDVISDIFEPTSPGVLQHIYGFVMGLRQKGIQKTEQMLRTGTIMTGIGELSKSYDGKSLKLQPAANTPFYLTNLHVTSLIKKLGEQKRNYMWLTIISGSLGVVLIGLIARRVYNNYSKAIDKDAKKKRVRAHDDTLSEIQLCIVCKENPREIILLPCGHVCLCDDCSENIQDKCPVCRKPIQSKAEAYIS